MPDAARTTVVLIAGMRDNACRERVAEALAGVVGVVDVEVSLIRGRAVVSHRAACDSGELVHAVKRSGYGATLHVNEPGEQAPFPEDVQK